MKKTAAPRARAELIDRSELEPCPLEVLLDDPEQRGVSLVDLELR